MAGLTLSSDTDWATRFTPSRRRCAALLLSFKKPSDWKKQDEFTTQTDGRSPIARVISLYGFLLSWTFHLIRLAACLSYPWPHMLDLCADSSIHRVLVPVPVLTAPINHSAVGAFNNIPDKTADITYMFICI